uniref:Uncharacterized protein n=1 Tax=Zea mays TaxID=4577 RepID=C4J1Y8_MAIZE|nr:unknown [Zea mays]
MVVWLGYTNCSSVLGKFSRSSVIPSFCTKCNSLSTYCPRKINHWRRLRANNSGKSCILMEVLQLHLSIIVVRQLHRSDKLCAWQGVQHGQCSRDI